MAAEEQRQEAVGRQVQRAARALVEMAAPRTACTSGSPKRRDAVDVLRTPMVLHAGLVVVRTGLPAPTRNTEAQGERPEREWEAQSTTPAEAAHAQKTGGNLVALLVGDARLCLWVSTVLAAKKGSHDRKRGTTGNTGNMDHRQRERKTLGYSGLSV